MATQTTLEILLKAQDQTRAAFEGVQKSNERIAEQVEKINKTVSDTGESAIATGAKFGVGFEVATKVLEKVVNTAVECAKAIGRLAERAEEIQNKAAITGFSTDSVQGLERLATNAGVSSEAVFRAISRMQRAAVDGKKGFTDLGIEGGRFLQMIPEDQLQAVAEKIMALPTAAERAAAAMDLFGRSGAELLPILDDIAKGSDDLQVKLSEEQVRGLADLDDSVDRVKGAFSDFGEQILATIATAPPVIEFLEKLANGMRLLAYGVKLVSDNLPEMQRRMTDAAAATPIGWLDKYLSVLMGGKYMGTPQVPAFAFGMPAPGLTTPEGPSVTEQYAEKALFKQLEYDEKRAASARKLQDELERLERRQIDGAMKVEDAQLKSWDRLDVADAAFTRNRMANEERIIEAENRAVEAQIADEERLTARMNAEEGRRLADAERAAEQRRAAMERILDQLLPLFEAFGVKADSALGKAVSGFTDLGHAALGVGDTLTALAKGDVWGAISAGIGVITAAVSGLKKLWDGIFGQSEIEKINDTRDAFISAHGGWLTLQHEIAKATDEDLLKQLFDAKTPEEYEAAIKAIEEALAKLGGMVVEPIHVPVVYDDPGYQGHGGGGGGETPTAAHGAIVLPFVPHAQHGMLTANQGGEQPVMAHAGEVVAPVKALFAEVGRAAAAAARAGGGVTHIHLHLDGKEIADVVVKRNRAGLAPMRGA